MFEPLRAEELTDVRVPRRLLNYGGLVDAIADRMVKDGIAVTKGMKGRRFRTVDARPRQVRRPSQSQSDRIWYKHGATPLWCDYWCAEDVAQSLRAQLDGATVHGSGKSVGVRIPIHLKAGVERDAVIDNAVERMRDIADALSKACPSFRLTPVRLS